jgi:oligopeptide transport system substrate-binding protein
MTRATARNVFSFLFFLTMGCTKTPVPEGRMLQIQLSAEPVSLDPTLAEDGGSFRILANVMEGLVGYDGAGELQMRLAESHRVSPDGKRYEFTLREGARWSDGEPVRAADFVRALRHALSRTTGAKLSGMLFPIRGARELLAGKIAPEQLGVSAPSDPHRTSFKR